MANAHACSFFVENQGILTIKNERRVDFREARAIYAAQNPVLPSGTAAQVVQQNLQGCSQCKNCGQGFTAFSPAILNTLITQLTKLRDSNNMKDTKSIKLFNTFDKPQLEKNK